MKNMILSVLSLVGLLLCLQAASVTEKEGEDEGDDLYDNRAQFKLYDKNNDGNITHDDLVAVIKENALKNANRIIEEAIELMNDANQMIKDVNEGSKVKLDLEQRVTGILEALDADKDGIITFAEFEAFQEKERSYHEVKEINEN